MNSFRTKQQDFEFSPPDMKKLFILIFVLVLTTAGAQNVMIIHHAFARPGDTIAVSASIANTDRFISFQFDLPLPENVSFLTNSIHVSGRGTNHTAIGNMVGSNLLRIFSYSPNNTAFQGNSGDVVLFQLVVGNIRGEFPLILSNCIIGDSLSANILTGAENGLLSVFPLGFNDQCDKSEDQTKLTVFPNPVEDHATVSFTVAGFSEVDLILINQDGRMLVNTNLGNFEKGSYSMELPKEMIVALNPGKIYYLEMAVKSKAGQVKNEVSKIIRP